MLTRSAKNKGKKLQNLVRDKLHERFPKWKDYIKSTTIGESGEDVQIVGAARIAIPFAIECKSRKAIAVYKDFEQAKSHAIKDGNVRYPLLVIKQNASKPLAVIDLDVFLDLLERTKI